MSASDSVPCTVILFGTNEWTASWQTRQHVASGLARLGYSVIYTTGKFNSWEVGSQQWKDSACSASYEQIDGVSVYRPGKLSVRPGKFKKLDGWLLKNSLKQMCARTENNSPAVIYYAFSPLFMDYIRNIDDGLVVYHVDDNFSKMPGWSDREARLEQEMLARADIIIGSSGGIVNALQEKTSKEVRLLPNGVDYNLFSASELSPCPDDLAAIPGVKIGYVGGLNMKVDYKTISTVAKARPEWSWVVIGEISDGLYRDERSRTYMQECQRLENVHFLGEKRYIDLPSYVSHMDVNTMCYRTDPGFWWDDIYPLKMHEYLATGNPVVSSKVSSVLPFSDVIEIASEENDWVRAIEKVMHEDSEQKKEQRKQVAQQNSWEVRHQVLTDWFSESKKLR